MKIENIYVLWVVNGNREHILFVGIPKNVGKNAENVKKNLLQNMKIMVYKNRRL